MTGLFERGKCGHLGRYFVEIDGQEVCPLCEIRRAGTTAACGHEARFTTTLVGAEGTREVCTVCEIGRLAELVRNPPYAICYKCGEVLIGDNLKRSNTASGPETEEVTICEDCNDWSDK